MLFLRDSKIQLTYISRNLAGSDEPFATDKNVRYDYHKYEKSQYNSRSARTIPFSAAHARKQSRVIQYEDCIQISQKKGVEARPTFIPHDGLYANFCKLFFYTLREQLKGISELILQHENSILTVGVIILAGISIN